MNRRYTAESISLLAPRAALPWTICVLFYGNHPELCRRFLDTLYRFTDPAAFRLRAGMNAVCSETAGMLRDAARNHGNISFYPSRKNLFKCPMMRRMFHDPLPDTEWTVWFDDDSHIISPAWIMQLALTMERRPEADLFGCLRFVDVSPRVEEFIRSASWYRGIARASKPPSRNIIEFPLGGFWAVRTCRLIETDWPDARLQHFEDDYLMAEAMRQQGVEMAHCESGVRISDAARRAPGDVPTELRICH